MSWTESTTAFRICMAHCLGLVWLLAWVVSLKLGARDLSGPGHEVLVRSRSVILQIPPLVLILLARYPELRLQYDSQPPK